MGLWMKIVVGFLGLVVAALAALLIWSSVDDGGTVKGRPATRQRALPKARHISDLEAQVRKKAEELEKTRRARQKKLVEKTGITGTEATGRAPSSSSEPSVSDKETGTTSTSFAALEGEVSGEIGVAYAPLGSTEVQSLGQLQVGHAWSSFKVPVSVTVMASEGGKFSSSQESLVASAITASDNAAAASLFSELEGLTGGAASQAVEETLSKAGAPTPVATAPPPPGAVSSWGQTEWPLSSATRFYNALACQAYGGATETILADMENVIAEQQWGLGQASFPAGTAVAFKAGWGPDGSESGPYLVRQSGIIRSGNGGAVVTIAAQDESGSFEAGVSDLDRVADWVAANVPLDGSC